MALSDVTRQALIDALGLAAGQELAAAVDENTLLTARPFAKYATWNADADVLLFPAFMSGAGSVFLNLVGTLSADRAVQFRPASEIIPLVPGARVGTTWLLVVINSSPTDFTWTVTGNTGVSLAGTMTVPQNAARALLVEVTGGASLAVQSLGLQPVASL